MDQIYPLNGYFSTLFGYDKQTRNQQGLIAKDKFDLVARNVSSNESGGSRQEIIRAGQ